MNNIKISIIIFLLIIVSGFSTLYAEEKSSLTASIQYEPQKKRDPFIPLATGQSGSVTGLFGVESVDDITLEGVVFDPNGASIVIANGVVLKQGESQGDVKVAEVTQKGVTFIIHETRQFKPFSKEDE